MDLSSVNFPKQDIIYGPSNGQVNPNKQPPFPTMLFRLLSEAESMELEHIVSWCPHGRAFRVHDSRLFVRDLLPRFIYAKKNHSYSNFERRLTHFGFRKIKNTPDEGGYWQPNFLRGEPELAATIRRVARGAAKHKNMPQPDFYHDLPSMPPKPINGITVNDSPIKNKVASEDSTPASKPKAPRGETKAARTINTPESVSTPAFTDDTLSIDAFLLELPKAMRGFHESMTMKQMREGMKVNLHTIDATIQCVNEMLRALSNPPGPDPELIDLVATGPHEGAESQPRQDSIDAEEASAHMSNLVKLAMATDANHKGKVPAEVVVYDGDCSPASPVETVMANTNSTVVVDFNVMTDFFDGDQDEFSQITFEGDTEVAEAKLQAETEAMFHQADYVAAVKARPLPTDDAFEAEMISFFFDI